MSLKHMVRREIERASIELGICLQPLSLEESSRIRSTLAARFSNDPERPDLFSYQNMKDYEVIRSSESWVLATRIMPSSPVFFFLNPDEEVVVWRLDSTEDVHRILYESFGFPFYLARPDLSCVVCVDDDDYLLATGDARELVRALRNGNS